MIRPEPVPVERCGAVERPKGLCGADRCPLSSVMRGLVVLRTVTTQGSSRSATLINACCKSANREAGALACSALLCDALACARQTAGLEIASRIPASTQIDDLDIPRRTVSDCPHTPLSD